MVVVTGTPGCSCIDKDLWISFLPVVLGKKECYLALSNDDKQTEDTKMLTVYDRDWNINRTVGIKKGSKYNILYENLKYALDKAMREDKEIVGKDLPVCFALTESSMTKMSVEEKNALLGGNVWYKRDDVLKSDRRDGLHYEYRIGEACKDFVLNYGGRKQGNVKKALLESAKVFKENGIAEDFLYRTDTGCHEGNVFLRYVADKYIKKALMLSRSVDDGNDREKEAEEENRRAEKQYWQAFRHANPHLVPNRFPKKEKPLEKPEHKVVPPYLKGLVDNDGHKVRHGDVLVNIMTGDAGVADFESEDRPVFLSFYDLKNRNLDSDLTMQCKQVCRLYEIDTKGRAIWNDLYVKGIGSNFDTVLKLVDTQQLEYDDKKRLKGLRIGYGDRKKGNEGNCNEL